MRANAAALGGGKTAMLVFDAVVAALTAEGLMVVLDNHMSDADWCCTEDDRNGLWYNDLHDEHSWVEDWLFMVKRFRANPLVVGAELRNEPRSAVVHHRRLVPTWGDGNVDTDFHLAYTQCGRAILDVNPGMLLMLDGLHFATNLTGAKAKPVDLPNGKCSRDVRCGPSNHSTPLPPFPPPLSLLSSPSPPFPPVLRSPAVPYDPSFVPSHLSPRLPHCGDAVSHHVPSHALLHMLCFTCSAWCTCMAPATFAFVCADSFAQSPPLTHFRSPLSSHTPLPQW